ncbi:HAD-IA family hydrolase [Corynebacterium sp. L4756]|uniref:HAD-IA family hydrolase n=1 Tax=unclassified Corynebacterium TaxID=2624378 RepID=UPI00374D95F4
MLRVSHGRRSQDTLADFLREDDIESAAQELEELELQDLGDVVALPGTNSLLDALPPERWAAVTSGGRNLMVARLHAAGLPIPEILIAAEDVKEGKPNPEGYLKAAAELAVEAENCVVIEGAPAGIAAGKASRATVIAVATSHSMDLLTEADEVIPDLS